MGDEQEGVVQCNWLNPVDPYSVRKYVVGASKDEDWKTGFHQVELVERRIPEPSSLVYREVQDWEAQQNPKGSSSVAENAFGRKCYSIFEGVRIGELFSGISRISRISRISS